LQTANKVSEQIAWPGSLVLQMDAGAADNY